MFVDSAPSFDYKWSSYAGSRPPTRIQALRGDKLQDVSKESRYRDFMLMNLRAMESQWATTDNRAEPNGYLAGWVAQKALVGQLDDAWRTMLTTYDHDATQDLCAIDKKAWPPQAGGSHYCPDDQELKVPFPEALAISLAEDGYISNAQAAGLGFDPVAISQRRKTDAAVATARYLQAWFLITRSNECIQATYPESPAQSVSWDQMNGREDSVSILRADADGKPVAVRVGEPKANGLEGILTFYRGVAECELARTQQKQALDQLR